MTLKFTRGLACLAVLLAFVVVILGAYTRLTDAGLGCPDWPGCYGHLVVPNTVQGVQQADILYPSQPVDPAKAWAEMIHRYAAATLGVLVLLLAALTVLNRRHEDQPVAIPIALLMLIIFQAALGRWTVTLQLLPVVVMGHLLGGMTILALLWLMKLRLGHRLLLSPQQAAAVKKFRPWAVLGLIILALQIALGGWTSANYAALACVDFPFCHGQLFPAHEFKTAFNFVMPIGTNFQGGVLDNAARMTIHMTHRLGALITALYLLWLSFWILLSSHVTKLRGISAVIVLILLVQIGLGMLNVVLLLPLSIAVMHNAVAALLLLSVVTLNYTLFSKPR